MIDPRIKKAADILVNYSCKVKKNEYVQILTDFGAKDLALECYKLCLLNGAYPKLHVSLPGASYLYFKHASKEQLEKFPQIAMDELKNTQAVIYISAPENTRELTNIDPKLMALRQKIMAPYSDYRVEETRWVLFDFPAPAFAQEADMSIEEFEDFVFSATNIDWEKESKNQDKLKKVLDKGENVHIIGKETDLTFSIKGRLGIKCDGERNMPDGEVFTTPVEDSVNGRIFYEFPAIHGGREVTNVRLEFKDGMVVKATADKNEDFLKTMLETDPGAKILGEFGIGTNYHLKRFIKNTLFDEKIGGTIHLALGKCYKETLGKNHSAIHWDMIKDLRDGGELIIDGKVIQKDGKFLI